MLKKKLDFTKILLSLPSSTKQIFALLCDTFLSFFCVLAAFYLRLDQLVPVNFNVLLPFFTSVCLVLPIFWFNGIYRTLFRYSIESILFSIAIAISIYAFFYFSIFTLYSFKNIPRSIGILQPLLLFFMVIISRLFIKFIIDLSSSNKSKNYKTTLIYGAGNAGRQLASGLENNFEFKVVGFLDDDKRLHGQVLLGHNIYSPKQLEKLIETKSVNIILLAIPSISRFKRNLILDNLQKYKLKVQTLPSVEDIVDGKITVSNIKEFQINDLLNRDQIKPIQTLMYKNIKSQVVMVTGAGGSIGSELCKQILRYEPKILILFEISEFALYKIYEELRLINKDVKIIPLVSNIQDEIILKKILEVFRVDTIYHAAAYKHVPIVEANIYQGIMNNIFGTLNLTRLAIEFSVKNFVLISTDKAVRPTNIMGATKRLAELCVQSLSNENFNKQINFSIVRFGNVLESSGSVIPKFKKQINNGGPITLTHPEVTRYFMTTTEAAQLVIQAGAMSNNCEIFVLDMGESIKIKDLIYRLVHLLGLSIKDEENAEGDIEIIITGLRPGEKLYEELFLGDNPIPTSHKKILKANDPFIPFDKLMKDLDILRSLTINHKIEEVRNFLQKTLNSYRPKDDIVDNIYLEHFNIKDEVKYKQPTSKKIPVNDINQKNILN